jgi:hypothetical protein
MPISLYDAVIPSQIQILESMRRLLVKAETFCRERGLAPAEILDARFAPDMQPFAYQIKSLAVHSAGAIDGVRRGSFSPDTTTPPDSFGALTARILETMAELGDVEPEEMEGFVGQDMRFVRGESHIDFLAEHFLLSFSQPNFYFHATTSYDLLRWKGLSIGKIDFNGRVRKKA